MQVQTKISTHKTRRLNARLEMRIDSATKLLAERAAIISGKSLSTYIQELIKKDAPKVIQEEQIFLSSEYYDAFMRACSPKEAGKWPVSEYMENAMKNLSKGEFHID